MADQSPTSNERWKTVRVQPDQLMLEAMIASLGSDDDRGPVEIALDCWEAGIRSCESAEADGEAGGGATPQPSPPPAPLGEEALRTIDEWANGPDDRDPTTLNDWQRG